MVSYSLNVQKDENVLIDATDIVPEIMTGWCRPSLRRAATPF